MESRFIRSWIGSGPLGWASASSCGILEGAVTDLWAEREAGGGEARWAPLFASSSMGKGAFKEPNESCLLWCGLVLWVGILGEEKGRAGGLQLTFLAFSARSALNKRSKGESCCLEGMGIETPREGDGEGDEPGSEASSGGGVGGPVCVLGGTDLDRNFGMGRADGAGEA